MVRAIFSHHEPGTAVRRAFLDLLKQKYGSIDDLNAAWKTPFQKWDDLLSVIPADQLTSADAGDCAQLATLFADAFFSLVRKELNAFSPGILYLGCRFNSASPEVVKAAARHMDVISINLYQYSPDAGHYGAEDKPLIITEFHYANVSGNNLGSGLRSAQDAVQQGRLLQSFIGEAVDHPQIVGAHWFQWRDQSVGGRYDGENYDVGFFDVADLPKDKLIRGAAESGRNLYSIINQEPHEPN
jgi:agarase